MDKGYVLYDSIDRHYFSGGYYIFQGEKYPLFSEISGAKVYKSKKRLENLLCNGKIPIGGGWKWEIVEVSDDQ